MRCSRATRPASRRGAYASRRLSRSSRTPCRPAKRSARGCRFRVRCRVSRKTFATSPASPRSTRSRPNRRCSGPSISSARRSAGQPTTFSVTYELTTLRPVPSDRSRQGDARRADARARAVSRRAAAAHRVHRRPAQVLARSRSATSAIRIASRRSCSSPSIAFRGPARSNTRRCETSATTRCMPATPTAASKRCC